MINIGKAVVLERNANDFRNMASKLLSANDLLSLAIRKSRNDWEGMASDAFTETTLHIQKRIINLMGDLIEINNRMLVERENILSENTDEEHEGNFSGSNNGGGGGFGGGGGSGGGGF